MHVSIHPCGKCSAVLSVASAPVASQWSLKPASPVYTSLCTAAVVGLTNATPSKMAHHIIGTCGDEMTTKLCFYSCFKVNIAKCH